MKIENNKAEHNGKVIELEKLHKYAKLYEKFPPKALARVYVKYCSDNELEDIIKTYIKEDDQKRLKALVKRMQKMERPLPDCLVRS